MTKIVMEKAGELAAFQGGISSCAFGVQKTDTELAADLKARLREALAAVCAIQDEARKQGIQLVGNVAYVEATGRCEVVHLSASKQL